MVYNGIQWFTNDTQWYTMVHKRYTDAEKAQLLQKCDINITEGGPRGAWGVCLFSELHHEIFSQKFWDFHGGSPDMILN